jgi:hypothetical protein
MLIVDVALTLLTRNAHLLIGCEALLDIPSILLTSKNGYNFEGG